MISLRDLSTLALARSFATSLRLFEQVLDFEACLSNPTLKFETESVFYAHLRPFDLLNWEQSPETRTSITRYTTLLCHFNCLYRFDNWLGLRTILASLV